MIPVRQFSFPGRDSPFECMLTLRSAGPMKGGIDKENRNRVFSLSGIDPSSVASCKQVHSRRVFIADTAEALSGRPDGDGILTDNPAVVPCVTVADCMPIWLFHETLPCFGVLHSGWKGTGIIRNALSRARERWNASPEGFRVIFGPHIRSCCYTVDDERASFFKDAGLPGCVTVDTGLKEVGSRWPWRLSLSAANREICLDAGIRAENILDTGECTACNSEYGSHRREGPESFTHMAALIRRLPH